METPLRVWLHYLLAGCFLFLTACEGDYRQQAIGENHEIIVVMDEALHEGETADALHETFGQRIETLPGRAEFLYSLDFNDFQTNEELDNLRRYKNVIVAGLIDEENNTSSMIRAMLSGDVEQRVRAGESFAFPLSNHWYRNQWTLLLTSNSDEELAEKIRDAGDRLVDNKVDRELERWTESVFRRHEQTDISERLWEDYGWSVRMQHDYIQTTDTLNFVTYRRVIPDNDRWMWGWWKDGVEDIDFVDSEWINATRDSLMEEYIRGSREGSYVETEYRRPVETSRIEHEEGLEAWETLGTWRMTGDFMGGPFVNFTYYDPDTERLFMVEYGQFAPRVTKRRFVMQFRAMGRTFRSDSTFTTEQYPEDYQFVRTE